MCFSIVVGLFFGFVFFVYVTAFLNSLDRAYLDLGSNFARYEVVASFMLAKPVSLLKDNIYKLEDDIFDEIEAPTVKVKILSLIPTDGSIITTVIFAVVPYDGSSKISETGLSLIRSNFVSLVIRQYSLRLTASLFGDPYAFVVLKFAGGITVIPQQQVFTMQKVQILFNFTLSSSINQTQENFKALIDELKPMLHLTSNENLYIRLTNPKGSTVATPTTVQTAVVLAIGKPSSARLKQLAQTITNSQPKNLGLNNKVFGKVKQVRLSSILQPSIGSDASPTPAPSPMPEHHRHHHHHHDEHHLAPTVTPEPSPAYKFHSPVIGKSSPAPAPVPSHMRGHTANPPHCQFGNKGRHKKSNKQYQLFPPVKPPEFPNLAPSPLQQISPPIPVPSVSSPLPHPEKAHVQSPAQSEHDTSPLGITPSISPSPYSSSAGRLALPYLWAILRLLILVLLLS